MEFIDHTGHVFSLPSYDDEPIELKYTENDYVFWINQNPVSIGNYYILPIRFLIEFEYIKDIIQNGPSLYADLPEFNDDILYFNIEISLDSNYYKLISPRYIQECLEKNASISQSITLDYTLFKDKLVNQDFYYDEKNIDNNLIVESNNISYMMFPFYVIAKSNTEGTFLTNLMIKTFNKQEVEGKTTIINLNREQLYDYLIKRTFSKIEIFRWIINDSGERVGTELYYTIQGYTDNDCEIITNKQTENTFRITNWSRMPDDVYHYIYRLPEDKWLKPNEYYSFKGHIYQSCRACGSVIWINHDYNLHVDNNPNNPFIYGDRNNDFYRTSIRSLGSGQLGSTIGTGWDINEDIVIQPGTYVRDFWFDIDNKAITDNTDGGEVAIKLVKDKYTYTPITVGGTFVDEQEELKINGRNLGINLPKEILRAIYQSSFYDKYSDNKLLNDKMKELLLNYMSIRGECGNFKSIINSLKWFGWADKVSISKLLKTDNEFQNQYILDWFNVDIDVKDTFKFFSTTNLISLSINENQETGEIDRQDFDNVLIGEGKPILENLFDRVIEVIHDDIYFYRPYYDFMFNELALKLDCLQYYYNNYFLPVHIRINRASIDRSVYANDMKLQCYACPLITASPILVNNNNIRVEFPETHVLQYYRSQHLIDSCFNEFTDYNNDFTDEDLFYVDENCIYIPIKIIDTTNMYSVNPNGEYILRDGNYMKVNNFYKLSDTQNKYVKCSAEEATHYLLTMYEGIQSFDGIERYSRTSEGYFDCKFFLTSCEFFQADYGEYALIDGEYLYFDKFYNSLFEESHTGQYVLINGEYIYIPQENRFNIRFGNIMANNTFRYYQTIDKEYLNFVIVPRLMNVIDQNGNSCNIDWLHSFFRISMNVNNKWFTYDFTIKEPNIYLEFGKLEYQYFIDNDLTLFNQIHEIKDDFIYFNSFMYQPDLITIDSLFYDNDQDKIISFFDKLEETQNEDLNVEQRLMNLFYTKYYKNSITIPYNPKYYNRIHLFKLYKDGLEIPYDGNPFNMQLYNDLFDKDNGYAFCIEFEEEAQYDAYVMHEKPSADHTAYWYIVLISRYPISWYKNPEMLDITTREYTVGNYTIKYEGYSIDKFLVNRMNIIHSGGVNHFNQDDLIVTSIYNNNYQFNIDLTQKWEIQKIYDPQKTIVQSNENIMIIPTNNYNGNYDYGYYNIKLNYSINGLNDNTHTIIGKYRINQTKTNNEYLKQWPTKNESDYFIKV